MAPDYARERRSVAEWQIRASKNGIERDKSRLQKETQQDKADERKIPRQTRDTAIGSINSWVNEERQSNTFHAISSLPFSQLYKPQKLKRSFLCECIRCSSYII